jgi:outer membrane protein TolC
MTLQIADCKLSIGIVDCKLSIAVGDCKSSIGVADWRLAIGVCRWQRLRQTVSGILVMLLVPLLAHARQPAIELTLEDAIARGIANSMRIAEMQARREAAEASVSQHQAERLPVLAVQGGYARTNHVDEFAIAQLGQPIRLLYPDAPDNYRARLDLQWPIYTSGRVDALERAALAERNAAGADLEAARGDLRLEITRAFWALVTAQEAEQVLSRTLAAIEAHVKDLGNRLAQGLIPPNELLSAEAQQSRERLIAIEAANARAIAEADLRRLLGVDGTTTLTPKAALDGPVQPPTVPEELVQTGRAKRPERRALGERVEAALARVDAAAAGSRPQVAVNGGYDYARPNPKIFPRADEWNDSWDVSLNVSWSLWDGGRNRAERAEAAAFAGAARSRAADFDRQLEFEIRQRRLELDSSRAAISVASDGVRAAAEARRVVGERFGAGVATSTEVLDAEADLLDAELARTRALANARLAEARLARAIGDQR